MFRFLKHSRSSENVEFKSSCSTIKCYLRDNFILQQDLKPPKPQNKRGSIISLSFGGPKPDHRGNSAVISTLHSTLPSGTPCLVIFLSQFLFFLILLPSTFLRRGHAVKVSPGTP